MSELLLDAGQIRELFNELAAELDADGVRAQMFVVGGAAMAVAFNTRRTTRDIDAVFEPKTKVYDAAARVANNHPGLGADWLNDAVKGFLPGRDPAATVVFKAPSLSVEIASPKYLFALKALAARGERDIDDLRFLYQHLGFETVEEAFDAITDLIPDKNLLPKTQFLLEEIAAELARNAD